MSIQEDRDYVASALAHLRDEAESRDLTDDEFVAVREGIDFVTSADNRITQLRELNDAVEAGTLVRGDGAAAVGAVRDSFNVNVRPGTADVFDVRSIDSLPERERSIRLRDNALRAVEDAPSYMTDAHKESAQRHIDQDDRDGSKARYILEHGSPLYHEAFRDYLRNPGGGPTQGLTERAALSLTGANGGYLVPFTLDPTIILTNDGATDPFRAISSVKTITTNTWNGVTSAGVTAEWIAEATEVSDASPTFTQPTITPKKADAYVQASMEVVADSAVSGEISMLIADAKARLEATAHAVGNGTTQPQGVVTGLQLVTASRVAGSSGAGGAADFVLADVYALANALPPRYRPNSAWVAEQSELNRIRRFGEGTTSNAAFWADLGVGIPSQLLGRPVYESSAMDNTNVSGSNDDILILGDFRHGFYLVDRMGLELVYNPLVLGSNRRPTGEVAWVAFWRHGSGVVDANAFRMLRV